MERSPPSDIEVLSTAELIRRRQDMFFDPAKPDIASELAMQALCHAADEAMDGRCRAIAVGVRGARVQVRYDCGMPLTPDQSDPDWTVAEMFLLTLRACSSRKKHLEIGSEFCSIGVAVLNAVCAEMNVDIVDAGQRAQLRFERGVQIGVCAPEPSELADGTSIEFELDGSVLPDADLSEIALRRALDGLAARFPEAAVSFDFRA